jgi:oligopeptide/dipeptide ABC transporter ATP-binding protein
MVVARDKKNGVWFDYDKMPPSGCSFRDRCPHAMPRCTAETPLLRPVASGHRIACHLD